MNLQTRDFMQEMEEKQEREKRGEVLRQTALVDAKRILALPEGRRFIKWLFRIAPLFDQCYTKSADTYYLLGRQSVSRDLFMLLAEADPAFMVPPVFQEDLDVEPTRSQS
jgi:hypothetical protein